MAKVRTIPSDGCHWLYALLKWIQTGGMIIAGVMSALHGLRSAPPAVGMFRPVLVWMELWLSTWGPLVIFLATCAALIAGCFRNHLGPPWILGHIHVLLCQFQQCIFPGEVSLDGNRVTLFKYVSRNRWWKFWGKKGYLIPAARSGHMTRESTAEFHVPDRGQGAEGIAGLAWCSGNRIFVGCLPDINGSEFMSRDAKLEYARDGNVSLEWLEERDFHARSLWATLIETGGKPWGVVIVDSRLTMDDERCAKIDEMYRLVGRYLSKLLENKKS